MDIQKTAREIGLFETAVNLAKFRKSAELIQKAGASMPLPDEDYEDMKVRIKQIVKWLLSFNKSKYMFLAPEIALIEEIGRTANDKTEVIIAVPCDLEQEAKERLNNNLPRGIPITVLDEPYFPKSFFPENGMIVTSGYSCRDRAMVLHDTYRMAEHYNSGFPGGKKAFISYTDPDTAVGYDGWMEINPQRINTKWRNEP